MLWRNMVFAMITTDSARVAVNGHMDCRCCLLGAVDWPNRPWQLAVRAWVCWRPYMAMMRLQRWLSRAWLSLRCGGCKILSA